MPKETGGAAIGSVRTLFDLGTVSGLTDAQLLERFVARDGGAAEAAFTALVERHGPMALRVCERVLNDPHDAHDAFQATFLVLVRRAGSVRKADSLASWIHGVAYRAACCLRSARARRRRHERRAAGMAASASAEGHRDDPGPVLHEELDRLPGRYREPIVLCDLEGLTHEGAADRIGVPVGTVKSRLARGRERLRGRLTRRGLAPSAGLLGVVFSAEAASTALPGMLVKSTTRTAMVLAAGREAGTGAVSASVAALARRTMILMFLNKMTPPLVAVMILAAASIGITSFAREKSAEPPVAKGRGAGAANGKDERPVRPEPVLEKALGTADQIPVSWMKAQALADIAAAQARLGQAEPARATFRRAARIIEDLGDDAYSRASNLSWLAKAQATAGDLDGARGTIAQVLEWVPKIGNDRKRQILLQVSATRQAKAGDTQGAISLVNALNDAPVFARAFALAEIAGEQAKAGDLRNARVTMARADAEAEQAEKEPLPAGADSLTSLEAMRSARVRGLAPLAEAEAKAGQIDAARATLRRARIVADRIREESRPSPLAEIAAAHRKAGDRMTADATLGLALKIADGLDDPNRRIVALARVAIVQADSGDRTAARETLDKAIQITKAAPVDGNHVLAVVARAQARVGGWEGGRRAALSLNDEVLSANHVEELAFEQSKAGESRSALEWAEAQASVLLRTHGLLGVVRGIIEGR